jgi:hypothetical protein
MSIQESNNNETVEYISKDEKERYKKSAYRLLDIIDPWRQMIKEAEYYDINGYSYFKFTITSFESFCSELRNSGYEYIQNKYKYEYKDENDIEKEIYSLDLIKRFIIKYNNETNKIIFMCSINEDEVGLEYYIMWKFLPKDIPDIIKQFIEINFGGVRDILNSKK